MSEYVYDTVNVTGENEEPLGGKELHELYIEFQQPESVYDMARVAEQQAFSGWTLRNGTESHEYMQIQQTESIDTARVVVEQTVFDGTFINTESQHIELNHLEGVYETVRVEEQKVSCQQRCY